MKASDVGFDQGDIRYGDGDEIEFVYLIEGKTKSPARIASGVP